MRDVNAVSIERKVTRQGVFFPVRVSFASMKANAILEAAEREFDRLAMNPAYRAKYLVLFARYGGGEAGFHIQNERPTQHFEGTVLKEHNR